MTWCSPKYPKEVIFQQFMIYVKSCSLPWPLLYKHLDAKEMNSPTAKSTSLSCIILLNLYFNLYYNFKIAYHISLSRFWIIRIRDIFLNTRKLTRNNELCASSEDLVIVTVYKCFAKTHPVSMFLKLHFVCQPSVIFLLEMHLFLLTLWFL